MTLLVSAKEQQVHQNRVVGVFLLLLLTLLLVQIAKAQKSTELQFEILSNNNNTYGGIDYMGNGMNATMANIIPTCIGKDPNSTLLFICDSRKLIRKITKDNLIIAQLDTSIVRMEPQGIAFDGQGGFFFTAGTAIYRAFANQAFISYAGSLNNGQLDSTLTNSLFNNVVGIVRRASTGDLYVADSTNHAIRQLNSTHVTTIAGSLGRTGFSSSLMNNPTRLALSLDENTLFVTDTANHAVRSVNLNNLQMQTIVGSGTSGYSGDGGMASSANLNFPSGIAVSTLGGYYISDTGNNVIRRVFSNGTIITICGTSGFGTDATNDPLGVKLNSPTDLLTETRVGGGESLYITDSGNNRIRRIDFFSVNHMGIIQTIVGSGDTSYFGDVSGLDANQVYLPGPSFLHVSPVTQKLLITDGARIRIFGEDRKLISSLSISAMSASWFHRNSTDAGDIFYSVKSAIYQRTSDGTTRLIAGTPDNKYGSEKGPAIYTRLNNPTSVFANGNELYVADTLNNRIRMIDLKTGDIQTLAGTGQPGYEGDGSEAINAKLNQPTSIYAYKDSIFFTDTYNNCVRKITRSTLMIDLVAGSPGRKFAGDGSNANWAVFNNPFGLAVTSNGGIVYIADSDNHRIRRITSGRINTIIGTGFGGYDNDGTTGTNVSLYNPSGLFLSGTNLYICDTNNHLVRVYDTTSGKVSIVAGVPGKSGYNLDNGPANSAYLNYPTSVAVNGNDLYIADSMNYIVRRVNLLTNTIETYAGKPGVAGNTGDDAKATGATLARPVQLAVSSSFLFIATVTYRASDIRRVDFSSQTITTLTSVQSKNVAIAVFNSDLYISDGDAGIISWYGDGTAIVGSKGATSITSHGLQFNWLGCVRRIDSPFKTNVYNVAGGVGDGLSPTEAILSSPEGVFYDGTNLYIADSGNHRVRIVSNNLISTLAGTGIEGLDSNFVTNQVLARLAYPVSVVKSLSDGTVYITDKRNHRIRKISGGSITTICGTGTAQFSSDSTDASKATLNSPHQISLSPDESTLYIADSGSNSLRAISLKSNIINTLTTVKQCPGGYSDEVTMENTCLNGALGVMATADTIFIADTLNNRIRQVADSKITTIAGGIGDGYLATSAFIGAESLVFTSPYSNDSIYIADIEINKIRQVSLSTGIITTIAGSFWIQKGNWEGPFNGDNLPATQTIIFNPRGLAFAMNGDIYFSDSGNSMVRKIFAANQTVTTLSNSLEFPRQLSLFSQKDGLNVIVAEQKSIRKISPYGVIQTLFSSPSVGLTVSPTKKIYFTDSNLVKTMGVSCPTNYIFDSKQEYCLPTCYGIIAENSSVCSRNGSCVGFNNCLCNPGYYGNTCDIIKCYQKLSNDSTVCSSRGNCVKPDSCRCNSNYFGIQCEVTTCNNTFSNLKSVCSSHGKCVSYNNCTCDEGHYGSNCEHFYCSGVPHDSPNVCSGRGSCSAYNNCTCQFGYFGNNCEKYTCSGIGNNDTQVCSSHGICSSYNNCTCLNGYYDSVCASFDCNGVTSQLSACENNGTCSKPGACQCIYGYDGARCEYTRCFGVSASTSKVCTAHGKCISPDNCQCDSGWDGSACNVTQCYGVYSYDPQVCSGHGTCAGRDFCQCQKGYSGIYCHLKLCFGKEENDTNVCTNRGVCIEPDNCLCQSGYNGNECQHHEVFMDPATVSIYSTHYNLMNQLEKDSVSCEEIFTSATDLQNIGAKESRKCQWRRKTGFKVYLGYNHTLVQGSVLSVMDKLTIKLNSSISDTTRAQALGATIVKPLDRLPISHDLVIRTNANYLYNNFKAIKQSWSCTTCPSQIQNILLANIDKPVVIIQSSNLSLITTTSGTLRTLRVASNSLNSLSNYVSTEAKYSFNPIAKTLPVNFDIWNEITQGIEYFECIGHTCIIESSITGLNTSLTFTMNDFFIVLNKDFQDKQMFRVLNKFGARLLENEYVGTCTVFGLNLVSYSSAYYSFDLTYSTFDTLDFYLSNINRTISKDADISVSVSIVDPFVSEFTPSDALTLSWSCYKLPGMIYVPECEKNEYTLALKSGILGIGSYMISLSVLTSKSTYYTFNGTIEIVDVSVNVPRIQVNQHVPAVYPYGDSLSLSALVYSNSELTGLSWMLLEGDLNTDMSNYSSIIESSTIIKAMDGNNAETTLFIDPIYLIEGERYIFQLVSSNSFGKSSANISTQLDVAPRFSCDVYDPLGENFAYSSKFVIYCINNLESVSSYWIDVNDDNGNRMMVLSNTMKKKFLTRLPYHFSGYLNIGIKLINRYGSFSRISRRVKVNSLLSGSSLSERLKYISSQYRALVNSEVTRIDTSVSIGCMLSFFNTEEDFSPIDSATKSTFTSTLLNMLSSVKKIQDISSNVDDKLIQLCLPVVKKILLTLQKVSSTSVSSSEVENWIKWIIQGVKKGSDYYSPNILTHLLDDQHATELYKLYNLLVAKSGPIKTIALLPEVLDIVNTYQTSSNTTTLNDTKIAISLEQGGEGIIESLQSTNQLNGKVLTFNNYKNLQVEFPAGFSADISASNFKMLSYVFESQASSLISPIIELSLLSSSSENIKVENLNNHIKLKFTGLSLTRDSPSLVNATCVYFDTNSQTWIDSGLISTITIVKSEGGKVFFDLECKSSHLTSFSIQELPANIQRNTSTPTNTDSTTTTIILAVVIPVSLLLIAAVVAVIATIIGLIAYFKKREERIKLSNSASNVNNTQELQYLSGSIDFPSNDSMFFKPLMSVRADSDTGSLDRSSSFDPLSRYTDLVRIGQGAFGSVFKANDTKNEGKIKALKVIKYSSFEELNNIMKEGTQLMNIDHPNILKVNEVFVNQDQLLIIDMDFYEMGDLTKLTDPSFICSEALLKKILFQMCSALHYVHSVKKMIHRDIKPSNIFIKSLSQDDIQVIIADFGLAKQSHGSIQNSYAGTPLFMSPELAVGGKYNSNTDMYSLGVAIFQIMTKDTTSSISEQYITKDPEQVKQWLTERMEEPKLYSKEVIDIVLSMLNKNSMERPQADAVVKLQYFH